MATSNSQVLMRYWNPVPFLTIPHSLAYVPTVPILERAMGPGITSQRRVRSPCSLSFSLDGRPAQQAFNARPPTPPTLARDAKDKDEQKTGRTAPLPSGLPAA
ncbi:hypothetical protein EHS25_004339 [Saitozyma podzolica]|uniref:Uncharacterized protein n=1 Tax=Saitozyma podzolica TaxID=1890683 RepID=A0A427YU52_9TREE|nr:hypothetical protein EHS25_004339 [Saitozyma podzolica]